MRTLLKNTGLTLAILILGSGYSYAQFSLTGELGVDLENHLFDSFIKDESLDLHINRSQSNHYLNLISAGVIKSEKFASYALNGEIYGTYLNTESQGIRKSSYLKPTPQSYSAKLSFFPLRRYPFTAFIDKSARQQLRYEQANKATTNILSPELAIVRRYRSEAFTKSLNWNYATSENISFISKYSNIKLKSIRNYDFDEDLNLWVVLTERLSDPNNPLKSIEIENSVTDDTILIYIDNFFIDSIIPGEKISTDVNAGSHTLEILSKKYNRFTMQLDVANNLSLKVIYVPPQGSEDSDQTSNDIAANLKIDSERFENDLVFSYSMLDNPKQNLTSSLSNLTNKYSMSISRISSFSLETSYNKNNTTLDTISSQTSDIFENKSALNYGKPTGISTSFSHTYSRNSAENNDLKTINKDQSFTNVVNFPVKSFNSLVSLSNSLSMRSNNTGYSNRSYTGGIIGASKLKIGKIELTPENNFQVSVNKQKNPDISSSQVRNKLSLVGFVKELWVIGDVNTQNQFEYTKSFYDNLSTINKLFSMDISIVRKFREKYQLMLQTIQEKETTGGSSPTPGENENQRSPGLTDQLTSTFGISLRMTPFRQLNVMTNYSSTKQNKADISSFSLSVYANVPILNLPASSIYMTRSNKMEGLEAQTQKTLESKLRYRFRQIFLELEHTYTSENLLNEKYGYHEVWGKISRRFGVF